MNHAITRRHFMVRASAYAAAFGGLQRAFGSGEGGHGRWPTAGPGYGPLAEDPEGLIDLPDGFSYTVFSRTGERMDDGLLVPGAHDGMAAFAGPDGP